MLLMSSNNLVYGHFSLKNVATNQLLVISESWKCGKTFAVIWEGQLFLSSYFFEMEVHKICTVGY